MCGGLNRHRRAVVIDDKCPLWVRSGRGQRSERCPLSARSGHRRMTKPKWAARRWNLKNTTPVNARCADPRFRGLWCDFVSQFSSSTHRIVGHRPRSGEGKHD
jgi:hypothetical protein